MLLRSTILIVIFIFFRNTEPCCGLDQHVLPSKPSGTGVWIITNETHNGSEIHRFFDTSPISPSSRFIATVQFSSFDTAGILDDFSALYKPAVVQVIDLHTGKRVIRDYTDAWDSQLGAQVQWGATDDFLFFNTLHDSVSGELQSDGCYSIVGVRLNIKTMAKTNLMCPVYHVSNDGKTAAAPNLLNIHFTQKGYGVRLLDSRGTRRGHRRGAAHDDGLFLTNTETGECRLLISLHRLALTVGQDTVRTPMYGFHTKFSSDGSLIMFVVRTMEQPIPPRKGLVRVQHMFVVDITGTQVRRMISWASYPFVPARCPEIAAAARVGSGNGVKDGEVNASLCSPVHLRDGNHPNWVPNSHRISMNLQKEISQTKPMSHATNMIHTVSKFFNPQLVMTRPKWNIVSLDVDAHADDFIFHYRYPIVEEAVGQKMQYIPTTIEQTAATVEPAESAAESASNIPNATPISAPNAAPNANAAPRVTAYHELHVRIDHSVGSGHPTYHPSGNYIITDAYPKEMQFLKASGEEKERTSTTSSTSSSSRSSIKGATGKVPLRLIEISTQREIQLLQVVRDEAGVGAGAASANLAAHVRHHFQSAYRYISGALSSEADTQPPVHFSHSDDSNNSGSSHLQRGLDPDEATLDVEGSVHASTSAGVNTNKCIAKKPLALLGQDLVLVEDKSWRCDLHPAWSRDFQWIAINGRPLGGERQVLLVHIGPDPAALFPDEHREVEGKDQRPITQSSN